MKVNGKKVSAEVEPRTLLVQYLRELLGLTGTHVGCDTTQCGCCVIHLNGEAVKSCTIFAVQCDDADVVTIEGMAEDDGTLHPMQEAFWEHHGLQCGFCTPGMVMMACDIARRIPDADKTTIRHQLEGNICRCTGYEHIVEAIHSGIAKINAAKG
jgi:carbon-monoxide dehydrogenase small subunit